MTVTPQIIAGPDVPPVIGPYSAAVRVGDLLFVSGQGGVDPLTGKAGETFREQANQVFKNSKRSSWRAAVAPISLSARRCLLRTSVASLT